MKKLLATLSAAVMLTGVGLMARAADAEEVTIQGEGQCAKCSLNETDACQNAVVVEEGGKEVTYLLAKNKVANDFHPKICKVVKTVEATGTVKEEDGQKVMTASKIELVEDEG